MKISTRARKFIATITMITVVPAMAACGGGEEETTAPAHSSDGLSPGASIACGVLFLFIDGSCTASPPPPTVDTTPADTTPEDTPVDDGSPVWSYEFVQDLEPNNTLENAQPVYPAPTFGPNKYGTVLITGSLNDQIDLVDTYILTVSTSADYLLSFRDCGADCSGWDDLSVFVAFFRLLDQDGNVLITTQADEPNGNSAITHLDAGIVYYVTVHAGDTTGFDLNYKYRVSQMPVD